MQINRFFAVAISLFVVLSTSSKAQRVPDAGSLMRQTEQNSPARRVLPDYLPPKASMPPELDLASFHNYGFTLKSVNFKGNRLMPSTELDKLVAPIIGKEVTTAEDLKAIVDLVTARYRQSGWIIKSYYPVQVLERGDLMIQIVENLSGSGLEK